MQTYPTRDETLNQDVLTEKIQLIAQLELQIEQLKTNGAAGGEKDIEIERLKS